MSRKRMGLFALIAAFALCMAAMCASFMLTAAEKTVSRTNIFDTSNAQDVTPDYSADSTTYLTYNIGEGGSVRYRRNLALKWFESNDTTADNAFDGTLAYFSLVIGFEDTSSFESFTVRMETTQFSMSKEGKTVNEITFTPDDSGDLAVSVNGTAATATVAEADADSIAIGFASDDTNGNFVVALNNDPLVNADDEELCFTNIGKYYAQYASSSADTPITPLAFSAVSAAAGSEEDTGVNFTIQSLNGQSFAIDAEGDVTDDQAPVLVVDSDIRQLLLGFEIDIETVTIDVCATSGVTTDEYYYIPVENGEEKRSFNEEGALQGYTELASNTVFWQKDFVDNNGDKTENRRISIAYELSDGETSAYYFIEWYAQADADGFIPVVNAENETTRPVMAFMELSDDGEYVPTADATEEYQPAVDEAALDGEGNSIQVGTGAYFYLPSLKAYITDVTCGYTDMDFTVYYRSTNSSSVSTINGSYDELRIELTNEGTYEFRVVPTNSAGRAMTGWFGEKGNYTEKDITTDNVFDAKNLCSFTFTVHYSGPVIEESDEEEDPGYVDATYSIADFEIIGVSGYSENYILQYFVPTDSNKTYTLDEIRAAEQADGTNSLGTWVIINKYDESLDDDDENNNNDYSWDPDSSLSFIPQERGIYKVTVRVTADNYPMVSASKYVQIASNSVEIPGSTDWLENNILSLVFLGIGVLCLIGIVVLLLIKPKDKAAAAAEKERKAEMKEKREKRK